LSSLCRSGMGLFEAAAQDDYAAGG